jgi:putative protein-disulfide isomerase
MKTKIYYVMDTMCGWCYGFSDVITKIEEKYKDSYDFDILPGGMWTDENVKTMSHSLGNYIKGHIVRIEQLTGKHFGECYNKNVLESNSIILDSFPGAKAVVLVSKMKKEVAFDFLKKIQEAHFVEGKDMNNLEIYSEIAESFNIPKDEFEKKYLSADLTEETLKAFEMVEALRVASFPTVIAIKDNKRIMIAQGYSSFEDLDRALSSLA